MALTIELVSRLIGAFLSLLCMFWILREREKHKVNFPGTVITLLPIIGAVLIFVPNTPAGVELIASSITGLALVFGWGVCVTTTNGRIREAIERMHLIGIIMLVMQILLFVINFKNWE